MRCGVWVGEHEPTTQSATWSPSESSVSGAPHPAHDKRVVDCYRHQALADTVAHGQHSWWSDRTLLCSVCARRSGTRPGSRASGRRRCRLSRGDRSLACTQSIRAWLRTCEPTEPLIVLTVLGCTHGVSAPRTRPPLFCARRAGSGPGSRSRRRRQCRLSRAAGNRTGQPCVCSGPQGIHPHSRQRYPHPCRLSLVSRTLVHKNRVVD